MNTLEVAIGQYARTILELHGRLAQAACEIAQLAETNEVISKELTNAAANMVKIAEVNAALTAKIAEFEKQLA